MDLNKLRTQVFEKTGIRIDTNDPVFALVALNEAVLSECIEQQAAGLQQSADKLKEQTRLLVEAGDRTRSLLLQMGKPVDDHLPLPAPTQSTFTRFQIPILAGGSALLSALLVIAGQAIFSPPRSAQPAPAVVQSPAQSLTPEQLQLIQIGEKYTKAWPKLDAKTQAKIQPLMQ